MAARGQTVMVGPGVEFGLEPKGLTGGLDVVPATVQSSIVSVRHTFSHEESPLGWWGLRSNGGAA